MPEDIISLDNERIKSARKLLTARGRAGAGRFLLEGLRLVEEAFGSGVELEVLFYTQDFLEDHRGRHLVEEVTGLGGKAWSVSQRVLRSLSETETPQGGGGRGHYATFFRRRRSEDAVSCRRSWRRGERGLGG
ncbi:MAG: hypothetical protein M1553_00870 [Firmicutes bacterium]|nr:hypothetical protein [Bacillota bacterium]